MTETPNVHALAEWLRIAIAQFQTDPPDTDYQRGYYAALLAMYQEGLGLSA